MNEPFLIVITMLNYRYTSRLIFVFSSDAALPRNWHHIVALILDLLPLSYEILSPSRMRFLLRETFFENFQNTKLPLQSGKG